MSKLDEYRLLRDRAQEIYEKAQAKYGQPDDKRERMERLQAAYSGQFGGLERERESWWQQDGTPIRVLHADEKMGGPEGSDYSMARLFRGLTTGNWRGAELEKAAVAENPPTSGGISVPIPLADWFVDRVRNQLALTRAGVRTVPMESSTLKIIRVTGDPTPGWRAENAAVTETYGTYDSVTLSAHTLAAMTSMSAELFEDSPQANDIITQQLAKVCAIELDRAGLFGTGASNQPTGVVNTSGVTVDSTTFGTNGSAISGTTPTGAVAYDWLSKAVFARRSANEEPGAYIISARTAGELDLLRASTGEPLRQPFGLDGLTQVVSNQVPNNLTQGTSSTASQAIVGDFSQLLMGLRHEVVFETSREATSSAGSYWQNLQVGIRCYLRADFAVARTSAFSVTNGIL